MFRLKDFRIDKGLTQTDLSFRFACPQAYISRMENFKMEVKDSYIDKLVDEFGEDIVNPYKDSISTEEYMIQKKIDPSFELREQEYTLNKAELIELLDYILSKTNYTYAKISAILFNNSSLIQQKIDHNRVEAELVNNIKKNVKKFGLNTIPVLSNGRNKWYEWQNKGIPVFMEPSEIAQGLPTSTLSIELGNEKIQFIKLDTDQFSPNIEKGTIVLISETSINELKDNHIYLVINKDASSEWLHLDNWLSLKPNEFDKNGHYNINNWRTVSKIYVLQSIVKPI